MHEETNLLDNIANVKSRGIGEHRHVAVKRRMPDGRTCRSKEFCLGVDWCGARLAVCHVGFVQDLQGLLPLG